jgi:hypothetical protein
MEQYANQSGALKLLRELLAPRYLFPVRDRSYAQPVIWRLRSLANAKAIMRGFFPIRLSLRVRMTSTGVLHPALLRPIEQVQWGPDRQVRGG